MIRSRRTRGWRCFCVTALFALAFVPALHAQNLLTNPNFDTQLPPWTQFVSAAPDPAGSGAAPLRVATPDIDANPGSGSALIDINTAASTLDASSGVAQCFNFASATSVTFVNYAMSFLVPTTTTADSSLSATVEIRLFANAGCSGFLSGGSQGQTIVPTMASDTTWYKLIDSGFVPNDAPVIASSAQLRGYVRQTAGTPTQSDYKINLDRFVLTLNNTTPVQLMYFDVN